MTMLLELLVECGKVGKGALPPFDRMAITEKRFFDAFFIPVFRQRPADPGRRGFLQVVMDRTLANRTSSGDLSRPSWSSRRRRRTSLILRMDILLVGTRFLP